MHAFGADFDLEFCFCHSAISEELQILDIKSFGHVFFFFGQH